MYRQTNRQGGFGAVVAFMVIAGIALMRTLFLAGLFLLLLALALGIAVWLRASAQKARQAQNRVALGYGAPAAPRAHSAQAQRQPTQMWQANPGAQNGQFNMQFPQAGQAGAPHTAQPVQNAGLAQRGKYAAYRPLGGFTAFSTDEAYWALRDDEAFWHQPPETMPWELPPEKNLW